MEELVPDRELLSDDRQPPLSMSYVEDQVRVRADLYLVPGTDASLIVTCTYALSDSEEWAIKMRDIARTAHFTSFDLAST
jgi:hypothetical protein